MGDVEGDDGKGDESTARVRINVRNRVWCFGWVLWYDIRAKKSCVYVGANWDQDWRVGGFPFARWNIKDSQDVRRYVGILKDAQIDSRGYGSARLKCRLLNVHPTTEKAVSRQRKEIQG